MKKWQVCKFANMRSFEENNNFYKRIEYFCNRNNLKQPYYNHQLLILLTVSVYGRVGLGHAYISLLLVTHVWKLFFSGKF